VIRTSLVHRELRKSSLLQLCHYNVKQQLITEVPYESLPVLLSTRAVLDPIFSPGMYETSRMTVFLGGHEVCTWPLLTTFCMAMGYALTTGFNKCIHTPSRYKICSRTNMR
jgi:hypothetical protein